MRAAPGARKKGGSKKLDYAAVAKGEAASAPPSATTIAQQRSQWVLKNLVGCAVKVITKDGTAYDGIMQSSKIEPSGLAVILSHARNLAFIGELPTRPERRVSISAADFAQIEALNVTFVHDAGDSAFGLSDGFKTDTDISGGQTGAMRELTPWMPDDEVPLPSHLDNTFHKRGGGGGGGGSGSGSWDQFATNEKLFGVRTTFNEDLYTTVIDKSSPDYEKNLERAKRIEHEIIHQVSSTGNLHMLEERGQLLGQDFDEEDRYGAVIRDAPKAQQQKQQQQQQQQAAAAARSESGSAPSSASASASSSASPGKNVYIPPAKKQQLASQASSSSSTPEAADRKGGNKRPTRAQAREEEQHASPSSLPAAAAASSSPSDASAMQPNHINGVAASEKDSHVKPATEVAPSTPTAAATSPTTEPSTPKATGNANVAPATASDTESASIPTTPAAASPSPAASSPAPAASPASSDATPSAASATTTSAKKPTKAMSIKAKEFVPSSSMRLSSPAFQPSYVPPRAVVIPGAMHPGAQQPLLSPELDSYSYARPMHVVPDEQTTSPQWIPGAPFEPSSPTASAMMYQPAARSPYGQQQLLPPYSFHSSPAPLPQQSRAGPRFYYDAYTAAAYPAGAAQYYMVPSPPGVYPQPIPLPQQPPHQQPHLQHDTSAGKATPPE